MKKPLISTKVAKLRLNFAKKYLKLSPYYWRKIIFTELQNQTLKELFNKYDIDKSVKIPLEFNKIYQTSYNYCTLYHKFVSFKKCFTGKSLSQINIRKRKNVNDTSIEF